LLEWAAERGASGGAPRPRPAVSHGIDRSSGGNFDLRCRESRRFGFGRGEAGDAACSCVHRCAEPTAGHGKFDGDRSPERSRGGAERETAGGVPADVLPAIERTGNEGGARFQWRHTIDSGGPTNNPIAQVANAAAEAASGGATSASSGAGFAARSGATTWPSQNSPLSAASQAKLAQLDQALQRMGINPTQISFADRIALLPLVNDPAAIQQYIQGLPTETAVLSPATSQVLAPTVVSQSGGTQTGASSVAGSASGSAASTGQISSASPADGASPTNGSAATAFQPGTTSFVAAVAVATRASDATGQKVNISV
jgi:hypothetical protein